MLENYPEVLTFQEVQEILRLGRPTVLALLESGSIQAKHIGKSGWRIPKKNLIDYLTDK